MTEPIRPVSEAVQRRWDAVAVEARKRRLGIEVRDGTADQPYRVVGKERNAVDVDLGLFAKLDDAFLAGEKWVLDHPIPGPTALRDELREHGRRLALLTARDVQRRGDFPLYRRFRDRILPLAWDNLVDTTKLEALESGVRDLLSAAEPMMATRRKATVDEREAFALAITTLRGLVEKEADGA